jgi:penicillin-binding protein 2
MVNGGRYYQPRIVRSIQAPHGEIIKEFSPVVSRHIPVSPETLDFLREALWGVVNSPGGTGSRARIPGFDVGGKTGTAQVIQRREGRSEPSSVEQQDHAWFACFAPASNPEIIVVVLIEHGGHGGATAAPVARKILETYNNRTKKILPSHLKVAQETSRPAVEVR